LTGPLLQGYRLLSDVKVAAHVLIGQSIWECVHDLHVVTGDILGDVTVLQFGIFRVLRIHYPHNSYDEACVRKYVQRLNISVGFYDCYKVFPRAKNIRGWGQDLFIKQINTINISVFWIDIDMSIIL